MAFDIVYLTKAHFWATRFAVAFVLLIIARYVLGLIFFCTWARRVRADYHGDGGALYRCCQGYLGMPFLVLSGTYRVLPPLDFQREITMGYVMELLTSLVPILVVILGNNSASDYELNWIESTSMTLRVLAVLAFIFEAII